MKEFSIGDFQLMVGGNVVPGFLLQTPIKGLESPKHRTTSYPRPGRDGVTVSAKFLDGRLIELVGMILAEMGESYADYEARRQAFIAATMNQRDPNGNPRPIRVSFTTLAGKSYYCDAYFNEPIMPLENPVSTSFMVTAVGNLIYGQDAVSSGNISRPVGGGLIIPFTIPAVSSASTGGTMILTNNGTTTTFPTIDADGNGGIILTGPLTNPVLSNQTAGKFIQLNHTLQSGDYIQIDMENQLILLNGSSSLISTKTTTSDWWGLEPGPNSISIDTSSGADTGYVTINFNPAFIGV